MQIRLQYSILNENTRMTLTILFLFQIILFTTFIRPVLLDVIHPVYFDKHCLQTTFATASGSVRRQSNNCLVCSQNMFTEYFDSSIL